MECSKTSFATEKDASFFIDKLSRTSTRDTKPIRAYFCNKCTCWHLTSRHSFESKAITEYKIRISELEKEISQLKSENNQKQIQFINRDEIVVKHRKTIRDKDKLISNLRKTVSDLVTQNLQLKKKL